MAPGYIDIHTHYDAQILWDPYCTIVAAGTASRRSCSATAGSGSRRSPPELRERAMLAMTRNEAIAFETMKEGMRWDEHGWVTLPEWLEHIGAASRRA